MRLSVSCHFVKALMIGASCFSYCLSTTAHSQVLIVQEHCDAVSYPLDKGRYKIPGTSGCRTEEIVLVGNWLVTPVVCGQIEAVAPTPFAWDPSKWANEQAIGVFARHVQTKMQFYLKIPEELQCAYSDFMYMESKGQLILRCRHGKAFAQISWNLSESPVAPTVIHNYTSFDTPARLPGGYRVDNGWVQIGAQLHTARDDKTDNSDFRLFRATDGGFFVVSFSPKSIGRIDARGDRYLWKWELPEKSEFILPTGICGPVRRMIILSEMGATFTLFEAAADGVHALLSCDAETGADSLIVSPGQNLALVHYSRDLPKRLDEAYRGLVFDLEGRRIVKDVAMPRAVYAITDSGLLVESSEHEEDFAVLERNTDCISIVQEFSILRDAR